MSKPAKGVDPRTMITQEQPNRKSNRNLDPKILQNLEGELFHAMHVSQGDSPGLPEQSVGQSSSSSTSSMSMEAFTMDRILSEGHTDGGRKVSKKGIGCCNNSSKKKQVDSKIITKTHMQQDSMKKLESLPPLLPVPDKCDSNKICLVLDLDETLVHSSFLPLTHADHTFKLGEGENQVMVYMLVRPGAKQFLKELGKLYELVVFTASVQSYADQVIDYIDPGRLVKHRLYRESCTDMGGTFVKDLSKLNRALERVIIIDNSPSAYLLQPYNAISINSWFDSENDNELMLIMEFLKQSHRVKNIYDLFTPE